MENLDFSEEEIQEQLAALGYGNITKKRLHEFKRDLDLLIQHEKSKSSTSAEWSSQKSYATSCNRSPPAFTKEKVQVPGATSRYNYIYSGNGPADQHRQVLTSTFNDENYDSLNLGPGDSYIKHSVAPPCIRTSTAPNRLEIQDESSDSYLSVLGASEAARPQRDLHTTTKPAFKRKVLRKHRGHSQVCDESTQSEDSDQVEEKEQKNCINLLNNKESLDEEFESDDLESNEEIDAELLWKHGSNPYNIGEYDEDFHVSKSSLPACISTSGYRTYKPDSHKDDLDSRDDCSLFELEYPNVLSSQDDPNLSCDRAWLSPDVAQQQITSVSLNSGDLNPFHSLCASGSAVYNNTDTVQGPTHENGPRSSTLNPEGSRILSLAAESTDLLAGEEKNRGGVHLQVTRINCGNSAFCHKHQEDDKTFQNNDAFNTRLNECRTTFKDRRSGDGAAKKTKKKSELFRLSELEKHMAQLHVSSRHEQHDLYSESEETSSYSDQHSSATQEPSAFQVYIKGMTRSHSENDLRPRLKSFIRPVTDHPNTRNLRKTDPVARYFQYKQDWEMFKPPGEKRRNELHWAIREQLAYQPPPPRPQRTYIPNTYVVPTEKKRSALRWEIRHDLANGIIPSRVTYT